MTLHALYRFYDAHKQLLYIGITNNPPRRLTKHRGEKEWWLNVATMTVEHYPTRDALREAERTAIQTETPRHNIRMNGTPTEPISKPSVLPCKLQLNEAYALGLKDGSCPVGVVIDGDESGVVLTLFDWFVGMFLGDDLWVSADQITRWVRAEHASEGYKRSEGYDPKGDVRMMEPLGDFQTRWLKAAT